LGGRCRGTGSRSYRGAREVRDYLESFAQQWEEIRFEPEGILDATFFDRDKALEAAGLEE
jgi:hypothetical protein